MISGANAAARGGDWVHTLELARGLAGAGVRVTLILRGSCRGLVMENLRLIGLPVTGNKYLDGLIWPVIVCMAALILIFRDEPEAVYVRDSIYELPVVYLIRLLGRPVCLEVNAVVAEDLRARERASWKVAIAGWAQQKACLKATLVLPVTTSLARWLCEAGVPAHRVAVVANAANPYLYRPVERKAAQASAGLDPARRYLCFAGNLAAWQGGEIVLEAFSRLARQYADVTLLVIGDGQKKGELEARARQLALPGRVLFTGRLPYEQVPLYMGACAAGIGGGWYGENRLLRRRFRSSGSSAIKVFSYLACGLPVVIPDLPDLSGMVRQAGCGLAAEPWQERGLETALRAILEYPQHWAEAGLRGRAWIERESAWEHRADQVFTLLEMARARMGGRV